MDLEQLRQSKRENRIEAIKLVLGMATILGLIGFAVGGQWVAIGAVIVALVTAWIGPRVSTAWVLRMYRARPILPHQAPQLYQIHQLLCQRAELDHCPSLYYIPSRVLNAFASGTDQHAVIAMTDGLIRTLNTREMAGVLAHEISHIRHHDVRIMSLADSFARITSVVSRIGLFVMLFLLPFALASGAFGILIQMLIVLAAPVFCTLLQLALSRSREFNADMGAIELTHDPAGLASALRKLERMQPHTWWRRLLYPGNREPESAVLRTHPHMHERVERLMELVPKYKGEEDDVIYILDRRQNYPEFAHPIRRRPSWHPISGLWH